MAETAIPVSKREAETPAGGERTKAKRVYSPAADIIERKSDIVLFADMPGASEHNVEITLDKNVLDIYCKVDAEIPENHKLSLAEYGIGDYHRIFTLSDEIDREKIMASVKNGVLKLILPKSEAVKTRKIEVKTE